MSGTQTTVRVVVAEDEVLVREGIRRLFEATERLLVVAQAEDLASLLAAVEDHEPDVVLTAASLAPEFTDEGIRFAEEVRAAHPAMAVIVLGRDLGKERAMALFEQGSAGRGYFLKDRLVDGAAFTEAVLAVAAGGSHVDVEAIQQLLAGEHQHLAWAERKLTLRELEILELMAEGRSNSAIARVLRVSSRAVERHVGSIFAKLDVDDSPDASRRVLAVLAYRSGRDESVARVDGAA